MEYIRRGRRGANTTPDLAASLVGLCALPCHSVFKNVPPDARCLIQGCSSSANPTALARFLAKMGVRSPQISVIDLIDIGRIFQRYGIWSNDIDFTVADATDLKSLYEDNSFDVAIQDHLLNCAPPSSHDDILSETVRILRPPGIGIVNFTTRSRIYQGEIAVTSYQFERRYGIPFNEQGYSLQDLHANEDVVADMQRYLSGKFFVHKTGRHFTYTMSNGNFEFFATYRVFRRMLASHGLDVVFQSRTSARDSNGLRCIRYRTLVHPL